MVKGQHVRKIHEDRVVQIDVGGNARGQALQHAHGFISKITDRAGREGRQAGNLHGTVTRAQLAQELKDVARVLFAVRSALDGDAVATAGNDLKRVNPEERVAAHALATLHALQQETVRVQIRSAPVLR